MNNDQINKILRPVKSRISNMVARAVLKAISDGGNMQIVQVALLADEVKDGVERVQQYGFTSVPHAGAEAVVVFPGGTRDHGLCVAVDDRRYRLVGLEAGEVAIYDDLGSKVHIKRDGEIQVVAATKVRIETPLLEVTGDIIDNCDSNTHTVKDMRDAYNLHTHDGVQAGGGNTGDPNQQLA